MLPRRRRIQQCMHFPANCSQLTTYQDHIQDHQQSNHKCRHTYSQPWRASLRQCAEMLEFAPGELSDQYDLICVTKMLAWITMQKYYFWDFQKRRQQKALLRGLSASSSWPCFARFAQKCDDEVGKCVPSYRNCLIRLACARTEQRAEL